jgi:hypothetical protein
LFSEIPTVPGARPPATETEPTADSARSGSAPGTAGRLSRQRRGRNRAVQRASATGLTDVTSHADDVRSSGGHNGCVRPWPRIRSQAARPATTSSTGSSSNPCLQNWCRRLAARARQRVHGQADRRDRRAVVAGDGRPPPAAPAALTPRTPSTRSIWNGSRGKPPRASSESDISKSFIPQSIARRLFFWGDPISGRMFSPREQRMGPAVFFAGLFSANTAHAQHLVPAFLVGPASALWFHRAGALGKVEPRNPAHAPLLASCGTRTMVRFCQGVCGGPNVAHGQGLVASSPRDPHPALSLIAPAAAIRPMGHFWQGVRGLCRACFCRDHGRYRRLLTDRV